MHGPDSRETVPQAVRRALSGRLHRAVRAPFGDVPGPFLVTRASGVMALDEAPTPDQESGMRALWWDGFWANIPETILVSYLGLYVIAFGGTTAQVGLSASLSSLFAALAFFPGARLVETFGHRKRIVLLTGGGVSRVALLCMAGVPFVASGTTAIWLVIALASVRGFAGYMGVPAWSSLTADVVPMSMRGRFHASRNFGMSIAALITAPLAGVILDRYSGLEGWQIVWLFAFAAGAASTWCFAQIPDSAPHADVLPPESKAARPGFLSEILRDRNFVWYLAGTAVWNIALQAAGPFFNVYLSKNLHASSAWIGVLTAIPSVTGLLGFAYFGRVMDERGTKWLMVVCGLLIPMLPAAWLLVGEPWHVAFVNAPAGVIWAGYQLASLNMVLVMSPPERRARYAAAFQTVVFASAFVGPLVGGQIISVIGFKVLFVFSSLGRLTGTLIVLRFVSAGGARRVRR